MMLLKIDHSSIVNLPVKSVLMSLSDWLTGRSPKPGAKRNTCDSDSDASVCSSPSKSRKFTKKLNQKDFDWYVQIDGKYCCKLCRDAKQTSAYAIGHDKPSKTTNHSRHAASPGHLFALQQSQLSKNNDLQKLIAEKYDRDDEMVIHLLKSAYHLAKRELPKEEMRHLVEFASSLGVEFKTTSSTLMYTSYRGVSELQSCLAEVILEDKIKDISDCGPFGVIIDESTDNANTKRLLMYAQYLSNSGEKKVCLLGNQQIEEGSANAQNLTKLVVQQLNDKGLDIKMMVGIGTDGASVMTGSTGGVVTRLREHSPSLVGVHCAAHRTALAASQAAKHVQQLDHFQRTVSSIFRYFKNSALRSNRLRTIQQMLNIPTLKYAEVHSVRWLSLECAVKVIYRTYPALVMALDREANFEAAARGLLQEVQQYKFVAFVHMLMDILPFLTILSKKFQTESLDYSTVNPMVKSTCESLSDLCDVDGVFTEKLSQFVVHENEKVIYRRPLSESNCASVRKEIQANIEFEGFSDDDDNSESEENVGYTPALKYYEQQKDILQTVMPEYINKLTQNLEDRFHNADLLSNMSVLIPKNICASEENVAKYGINEIDKLVEHFEGYLPSPSTTRSEYQTYKRLVLGNYKDNSVCEVLKFLISSNDLLNIIALLKCCLVIPVTSVQCERGFSTQNRIKTKTRTSLKSATLDDLMRISEDGPSASDFDFAKALRKWKLLRNRKLDEAVRSSNTPMTKSSVEMENHVYNKAKSREEYLALVARLILHVKDFNNSRRDKQAALQQAAMAGGAPNQMGAANAMGQPSGMQDPINALQNMAMSGAGMGPTGQPGMMSMGPQMALGQPQQQQQQMMQRLHQQRMAGQQMNRPSMQRQDAFIVTSSQTIPQGQPPQQSTPQATQMSFGPTGLGMVRHGQYTSGMMNQQASPQMVSNQSGQGTIPSPAQQSSQQQPAGSPMSMMTSPTPQIVPSPGQRGSMSVGAPSPSTALNTPGNPGSVGASPSPASQSDEQAYLDKLKQLSKYIEPLRRMIKKTEDGKDSENRRYEISKLKNLLDILINPNKRVPMATLLKCEQGLEKMHFSNKLTNPITPQVHMCQPLLDSFALHMTSPTFNHTLQRTFGPSVAAIFGNPIRVPSPPPKRQKVEEKESRLPDILQGEIVRLDHRFRIKLDPVQHAESKDVNLLCKLEDHNLPSVPPIIVMIPHDYPHNSPELVTSKRDYDSTQFLKSIQTALETHLLELPSRFSFTSLLDMWEGSVRKACHTTT